MPRGRPSKFTPEIAGQIVARLRQGCFRRTAAEEYGISYSTLRRWLITGQKFPDSVYASFWEQVQCAEAEAENEAVAYIHNHCTDWRSRSFWLTHARSDRWGLAHEVRELKRQLKELEKRFRESGTTPPAGEMAGEASP